jgi:hypothetical protein
MKQLVKRSIEKRRARLLKAKPQARKTFPPEAELRLLGRSVIKRQLHPLIILPDDVILDGECRWRGLMLENPDFECDVIVVDRELAPGEAGEIQLISALHSTCLAAYDQAVACKEWLELNPGAPIRELAEKIDRDPSMLTRLNSLWKTIPDVVKAAEEGKVGPKAWYQISLVEQKDQPELLAMYLSGIPSAQISELRRKPRKPALADAGSKVSRIKCQVPGRGTTVVVTGEAISLGEMIETLADLLKLAKRESDKGLDSKTFERVCRDLAKKA